MSKYSEREALLLEKLKDSHKLTTGEASKILDVSESSTRRIFSKLEKENKIVRIYGGIQYFGSSYTKYSFDDFRKSHIQEKTSIARNAVSYINDYDVLYFDCGTTLFQLAQMVAEENSKGLLKNIKVITNSLMNLEVLHPVCDVILAGGNYNSDRKDFAGYFTENYIRQFSFNKAFLGADAYNEHQGFMSTDESISRLNRLAIKQSDKKFVLIDSTKIGRKSFVSYAMPEDINMVFTDDSLSEEQKESLQNIQMSIADSSR